MSSGINLVRGRQGGQLEKQKKILKTVRTISALLLVFIVLLSVVFFLISAMSPINSLQDQEKKLTTDLLTSKNKAVKLLLIENRVKEISTIQSGTSHFDKTVSNITQAIPSSISVDSFSLDKTSLVLTAKSDSLYSIDLLLNNLSDMVGVGNFIEKITVKELVVDPESGLYTVSLLLNLL